MASTTEIANQALSNLGTGFEIANLDTEKTEEAAAARRYYDRARDGTLRDFPWPFATKFDALALVETLTSATREWEFSYRYPADAIMVRRLLSGLRNDNRQTRVPYKLLGDDAGGLIYTNLEDAEVEYTRRVTDPAKYPEDFIAALSWRLAWYMVPRLTRGDPNGLRQTTWNFYLAEISTAQRNAGDETQPEEEPQSEFVRAREGLEPGGTGLEQQPFPTKTFISS